LKAKSTLTVDKNLNIKVKDRSNQAKLETIIARESAKLKKKDGLFRFSINTSANLDFIYY